MGKNLGRRVYLCRRHRWGQHKNAIGETSRNCHCLHTQSATLFITSISILLLCDTHRVKSMSYFTSRGVSYIINTGQHSITTLTAPFSLPFPFIFGITAAQCPISWSVSWQVPQCPHICASPQPDLMHRTFHLRPNFSLLAIKSSCCKYPVTQRLGKENCFWGLRISLYLFPSLSLSWKGVEHSH